MRLFRSPFQSGFIGLILMVLALMFCQPAAAESLHPFKAGSLSEIKAARAGKPFILLFWSLDCASCMKELDGLAAAVAKYPDLDLVMVSTDEEDSYGNEVEAMLAKHHLQNVQSWIFADSNVQRLRYEIDPTWFGELPRSYFYDAAHNRLPHSGVLGIEYIEAWRAAVKPGS